MKAKTFTPPYRVGRCKKRAVLDANGVEVVIFSKGLEQHAQEYCDYLNSKSTKEQIYGKAN